MRRADRLHHLGLLGGPEDSSSALASACSPDSPPCDPAVNRRLGADLIVSVVPVFGTIATSSRFSSSRWRTPSETQAAPWTASGMTPEPREARTCLAHPPLLSLEIRRIDRIIAHCHRSALSPGAPDEPGSSPPRHAGRSSPGLRSGSSVAARGALGVRGSRVGRLHAWDPVANAALHALARGPACPPLGDDPGEARDAPHLERAARSPGVLTLALRHLPHAVGRRQLESTGSRGGRSAPWILAFIGVVVTVSLALVFWRSFRGSDRRLDSSGSDLARRQRSSTTPAPAGSVLTIFWGVVYPLLSEALRGEAVVLGRGVLRLLPAHLRAPAALAHGDRAAHCLAPSVAPKPLDDVPLADCRRPRRRRRPPGSRCRELDSRADRVHVRGIRHHDHHPRVRPRHESPQGARSDDLARSVLLLDRAEPSPLRRLRRPCRRSCCWR